MRFEEDKMSVAQQEQERAKQEAIKQKQIEMLKKRDKEPRKGANAGLTAKEIVERDMLVKQSA
jgi:hypothetical protein